MGNALATYQGRDGSGPPPETVTLLDLPLLVIKKILVYLSAEDVWQLGATCRQLRELCADDKLWRDRMVREARTLVLDELSDDQAVLLHQRHHITMTVRNPHLDEPRLHWSSTRPRKRREPPSRGALLDSWALITDLVTGRSAAGAVPTGLTPRILMYGSGLENKSPWERQSLLRRIMKGKAEEGLHVHSLAPRPNRDVDAGWRFRFSDDATFDLIPLFSTTYITFNTSEVRRPQTLGSAASQTRLYGGRLKMEYFVTKELQHADGVVHVVEAAEDKTDYGFESLEQEAMQEAMTAAGRQLPLLTLLLAAEPPEERSATLGWRVQQRLATPTGGPHAVLTTSVCSLTDLSRGFSWLAAVCRREHSPSEPG